MLFGILVILAGISLDYFNSRYFRDGQDYFPAILILLGIFYASIAFKAGVYLW